MSTSRARLVAIALGAACLACATAPREGESVHIAEESALILWDAESKTQHFIRRASFETAAKDFGFLVPTPSAPKLAEAHDLVFRYLEDLVRPKIVAAAARKSEAPPAATVAAAPKVVVLERVQVAGYDAAVLAANDAGALASWLKSNGYASTPELTEWSRAYVDSGWIITAFKIAADRPAKKLEASAVRMSFATDRPFFPYREPASSGPARSDRELRIYFLGDARPEGRVGAATAWPGKVTWSDTIQAAEKDRITDMLNMREKLPDTMTRLTVMSDRSSPRPAGGDLFFATAADQSFMSTDRAILEAVERERRWVIVAAWIGAAIGVLLLLWTAVYLYRRTRRDRKPN